MQQTIRRVCAACAWMAAVPLVCAQPAPAPVNVSPTFAYFRPEALQQSPSGKIISLASSADGRRLYAGAYSGVWRSDDGGATWRQPQTASSPSHALRVPNVYALSVSPANADIVLAATAGDGRTPPLNGVYRSENGGITWSLSHRFACSRDGQAGQIAFAPDDANLVYAAGGCAIAVSTNGGRTWREKAAPGGATLWHLAVTSALRSRPPASTLIRKVYAVGPNQLWYSTDGGDIWTQDSGVNAIVTRLTALHFGKFGFPPSSCCSGGGDGGSQILAVEPGNPDRVYLAVIGGANGPSYYVQGQCSAKTPVPDGVACNAGGRDCGEGSLWLGDFSRFDQNGAALWTQAPGPPVYWGVSTISGNVYVAAKRSPSREGYLLFFSDAAHVHMAQGPVTTGAAWHRLDGKDASETAPPAPYCNQLTVHVDPHAFAVSPEYDAVLSPATGAPSPYDRNSVLSQYLGGTIWMANDGGVARSVDGGETWQLGGGLATLQPVNLTGVAASGSRPALYMGTGDNDDFFSLDGGATWQDPVSACFDRDAWFSDPAQPWRVMQFAPRDGPPGFAFYVNPLGGFPDARDTSTRRTVPYPVRCPSGGMPPCSGEDPLVESNADSSFYSRGYRPIVQTLTGEQPMTFGDYVLIRTKGDGTRALLRMKNSILRIANQSDWDNPMLAAQQGPNLSPNVDIVQASGGHATPVFYVSDSLPRTTGIWKWTAGMASWQRIVGPGLPEASADRFFSDPYDSGLVYMTNQGTVKRTNDGGNSWHRDHSLENALTENSQFSSSGGAVILRDMIFDRNDRHTRFAIGDAGVFYTVDGHTWRTLLSTWSFPSRPVGGFYDPVSDPCSPSLYVALNGRGIVRIGPLPTERSRSGACAIARPPG